MDVGQVLSCVGVLSGVARTQAASACPWLIEKDLQLVVLVGEGKKLMCLADVVCHTCRTAGVTQLSMMDHDMIQKSEDWFLLTGCNSYCCFVAAPLDQ